MATTRDWLNTLWDASYKGVPFLVEHDTESGRNRNHPHEFPMRDVPFIEELGEGLRKYNLTAYVASDAADSEAAAVMAVCAQRGAGLLVLPTHGPILVKAMEYERSREKNKHGYIALSLSFLRDGESSALISTAILSNSIFVAIDGLAIQTAAAFAQNLLSNLQPDFVVDAAINGLLDGVAMVESLRTSMPVDVLVSSAQRNELTALFAAIPELIHDAPAEAPARLVASLRAIAGATDPVVAVRATEEALSTLPAAQVIIPSNYRTPRRRDQAINAEEAARVARVATIAAYCEAVALTPLPDRQAALTLRANVVEFIDAECENVSAANYLLYNSLIAARDATINYLSRAVLDLKPVRVIEANQSMPALYWAWRFHKDPNRAMEIVRRNRVADPAFIPPTFEILAD